MLEHLYNLAPGTEPGFRSKPVGWAISLDRLGQAWTLIPLEGREFRMCPELDKTLKQTGGKSDFLADRAEIVALHIRNDISDEERGKLERRHRFFIELLTEVSQVAPELEAVAELLGDDQKLKEIRTRLAESRAKPTDQVTFMLDDEFLLDRDDLRAWWRERRNREIARKASGRRRRGKATAKLMRCYVTGELTEPKARHFDIGGAVLVCFDKPAFESYGLREGENAAVSESAAAAYRASLNNLVRKSSKNLAGAKVVYWFKGEAEVKPEDDLICQLWDDDETKALRAVAKAKDFLKSIEEGDRAALSLGRYHYYALTYSRQEGRLMVRDWMEGQFEELVRNYMAWYDDLAVPSLPWQRWFPPGIERVVTSLLPPRGPRQKYRDWIKPVGSERLGLWHAAIRGDAIPYSVLPRLVALNRDFVVTGTLEEALQTGRRDKKELEKVCRLLQVRMGLIAAYHRRTSKGGVLLSKLDAKHPEPAYHCGRLLAVMARLQRRVMPNVKAGVIQRYYTAASMTPALVLPRLDRLSKVHLSNLGKKAPGLANWYENMLAGICGQIDHRFPRALTIEQQSLFCLGYYHQLADRKAGDPDEKED